MRVFETQTKKKIWLGLAVGVGIGVFVSLLVWNQLGRSKPDLGEKMARSTGVKVDLWRDALPLLDACSVSLGKMDLSEADRKRIYDLMETGNPSAVSAGLMAISRCFPESARTEASQKLKVLLPKVDSEDTTYSVLRSLWNLDPQGQASLIALASMGQFPHLAEKMKMWPPVLTEKDP
ncbi:MAG: hypothetical protein MUC92_12740 [Fimbriimonadaceae bacterium]|jgi:hypothetical protein|nr:hypothetical protein [Fimbriimonadaceae bacterium]